MLLFLIAITVGIVIVETIVIDAIIISYILCVIKNEGEIGEKGISIASITISLKLIILLLFKN